jgi:hypothetical protein
MAVVVVGHALDVAEAQRQQRLGAFERLNLALLVEVAKIDHFVTHYNRTL